MTATQQILTICKKLISEPGYRDDYLLKLKKKYKGITGYFSNYIPEEIIAAAGFHPLRIIGSFQTSKPSQDSLFKPICSFARDVFSAAKSDEFAICDNIIFPNSCDSLQVLEQMWKHDIKKPPAYTLLHPVNADDNAIEYFADQLKIFAAEMQKSAGVDITETDLKNSIARYNQTRSLLRELYDIRKKNTAFIKGSDSVALTTAGLIMDRDEYNQALNQIIEQRKENEYSNKNLKRIMLIGPLVDNYMLLNVIEEHGAYIVYDDITNGSRYCDLDVKTDGDLYRNLAKRYLLASPSPTLNSNEAGREQSFIDTIHEYDLDGVVFIIQKFCEPHVHKYLAYIDILKKISMSFLLLEVEHGNLLPDERDMLRIESFIEIAARG